MCLYVFHLHGFNGLYYWFEAKGSVGLEDKFIGYFDLNFINKNSKKDIAKIISENNISVFYLKVVEIFPYPSFFLHKQITRNSQIS